MSKIFNKLGFIFSVPDPLLFFPAHGKILAWQGEKITQADKDNLKSIWGNESVIENEYNLTLLVGK